MVKIPTNVGSLAVPNVSGGIATANVLSTPATPQISTAGVEGLRYAAQGLREQGRLTQANAKALAGGLFAAEAQLLDRRDRDEEREVKQLDVAYAKERRLINTEFRTTQGQNTLEARKTLEDKYKQAKDRLILQASSSRVRNAFGLIADAKTQGDLESNDGYTEGQRREANRLASEAVMEEAYQTAIESPLDEAVSVLASKDIESEILSQAEENGWSDEVTKGKYDAAISQLYKSRVIASSKDYPDQAWAIYEQHKDEINGDVRVEIEKHLEDVTLAAMAQNYAQEAMSQFPGDITAQRAYIRETLSGKKEEAALTELQGRLEEYRSEVRWQDYLKDQAYQELSRSEALNNRNEKINVDNAQDSLNAWLREKPGVNTRGQWEIDHPEEAKWLIKDVYKSETMDRVEARLLEDSQYATVSESSSVTKYTGMSVADLANISESELENEKANLSQPDWKKLERRVNGAKASMDKATGATSTLYSAADKALARITPKKGDKVGGKSKIKDSQYNTAQAELYAYIDEQVKAGVIPKHADIEKEAQRLILQIKSDPTNTGALWYAKEGESSWNGVVAQIGQMSPQQKAVAQIERENIPQTMLDDIEYNLELFNIPDTGTTVEELAAAIALKDGNRIAKLLGFKSYSEYAAALKAKDKRGQ